LSGAGHDGLLHLAGRIFGHIHHLHKTGVSIPFENRGAYLQARFTIIASAQINDGPCGHGFFETFK